MVVEYGKLGASLVWQGKSVDEKTNKVQIIIKITLYCLPRTSDNDCMCGTRIWLNLYTDDTLKNSISISATHSINTNSKPMQCALSYMYTCCFITGGTEIRLILIK